MQVGGCWGGVGGCRLGCARVRTAARLSRPRPPPPGSGGYSYLAEPLWWAGLLTMVVGEVANFAAYAFAPAILVTPLGALSIIVSAILAHALLNERLNVFGLLGCVLCITGSLGVVLHAPEEDAITSVLQVWDLAMQPGAGVVLEVGGGRRAMAVLVCFASRERGVAWHPCCIDREDAGRAYPSARPLPVPRPAPPAPPLSENAGFLLYALAAVCATLLLIFYVSPERAAGSLLVYVSICSIVGSLSVMSCKALGTAVKLTLEGESQLGFPQTYAFMAVVAVAVVTQMNYLNRALDLFNTAIVTPIYYVMFTTLTIAASAIMFRAEQRPAEVVSQLAGFVTIVCGTFLLHATQGVDLPLAALLPGLLGGRGGGGGGANGGGGGGSGGIRVSTVDDDEIEMGATSPKTAQLLRKPRQ